MEENLPQSPKNELRLNKYLIFLLPVVAIFLFVSGYFMGKYSNKLSQPKDNGQIEETEQTPISTVGNITPTITNPPISKTSTSNEKIVTANLGEDCKITVTSTEKKYEVSTGLAGGMDFKCTPSLIDKISSTGKFLAYEDMSGGVDSVMALFTIDYGKSVTLGVWGTSSIMDYIFLPDDRLVAINGYPDIFDEQWLTLFDLPKIFENFSSNFNEHLYLTPINPTYESTIQLPNAGQTHSKLSFSNGLVQTKSKDGRLLVQYKIDDLIMNGSGNYTINPRTALTLVYYEDKDNVDPADSPIIKQALNAENSTNDYWAVDIINTQTESVLRSYQVNQKTGEVTPR
jgi:hypothetical protein